MRPTTLARIFASAREGTAPKLTRDELILEFTTRDDKQPRALVERIARREFRKQRSSGKAFISLDDIRGELTVSLIRLIDRYEEGRSDSLDAYLAQHLRWRAVDATENAQMLRDTHQAYVGESGEEELCGADRPQSLKVGYSVRGRWRGRKGATAAIPLPEDSSARLDVDSLLGRLGDGDRAVIEMYLAILAESELTGGPQAKVTQLAVATAMGISRATVSRAIKTLRSLVT